MPFSTLAIYAIELDAINSREHTLLKPISRYIVIDSKYSIELHVTQVATIKLFIHLYLSLSLSFLYSTPQIHTNCNRTSRYVAYNIYTYSINYLLSSQIKESDLYARF